MHTHYFFSDKEVSQSDGNILHFPSLVTDWNSHDYFILPFLFLQSSWGWRGALSDLSHWQISIWRCGTECHKERSPYCSLWGKCQCQSESDINKKQKNKEDAAAYAFIHLTLTLFVVHFFVVVIYLVSLWVKCWAFKSAIYSTEAKQWIIQLPLLILGHGY